MRQDSWEDVKLNFRAEDVDKSTFRPINMAEALEQLEEYDVPSLSELVNAYNEENDGVGLSMIGKNNLRLPAGLIQSFFEEKVHDIELHLQDLCNRVPCTYVMLVGGFGQSPYLQARGSHPAALHAASPHAASRSSRHSHIHSPQHRIKSFLPNIRASNRPAMLIASTPGLAVVKGAVRYGLSTEAFASRILRFSYGVETSMRFNPAREEHKDAPAAYVSIDEDSERRINKVMSLYIEKGSEVQAGRVIKHSFQSCSNQLVD